MSAYHMVDVDEALRSFGPGGATADAVIARLPHIPESTVRATLSALKNERRASYEPAPSPRKPGVYRTASAAPSLPTFVPMAEHKRVKAERDAALAEVERLKAGMWALIGS